MEEALSNACENIAGQEMKQSDSLFGSESASSKLDALILNGSNINFLYEFDNFIVLLSDKRGRIIKTSTLSESLSQAISLILQT